MKESIQKNFAQAGVEVVTPEAIDFITRKIHHNSRDLSLSPDNLIASGMIVTESDVLRHYVINGGDSGLILKPTVKYSPVALAWLLGGVGLSLEETERFIRILEGQ